MTRRRVDPGGSSIFAATRVLVADVEQPAPDLSELGQRYGHAWVVIRRTERPRSLVEVDLGPDGGASREHFAATFETIRTADDRIGGIPAVDVDQLPSLSVVIPTVAERLDELAVCLASIDRSDVPRVEVLVVDNRRTVPTVDLLPGLVGRFRGPGWCVSASRPSGRWWCSPTTTPRSTRCGCARSRPGSRCTPRSRPSRGWCCRRNWRRRRSCGSSATTAGSPRSVRSSR